MFEDFDFKILDDPEFKEDAVREEIVTPILKELGYSATGENRIIRSRSLTHPFVYIGTMERKINIIPDYLLTVQNANAFILDAKAPNQDIHKGKNVEQAYSYAIHRDIRTPKYALCNGKELTIFTLSKYKPIATISINQIDNHWTELQKHLSSISFTAPNLDDFHPDFGLSLIKAGFKQVQDWHFVGVWVNMIVKIEDDLYTISSAVEYDDMVYEASFDFNRSQYLDFLEKVPPDKKEIIQSGLSRIPYRADFNKKEDTFEVIIHAKLADKVVTAVFEDFLPFEVISFEAIPE